MITERARKAVSLGALAAVGALAVVVGRPKTATSEAGQCGTSNFSVIQANGHKLGVEIVGHGEVCVVVGSTLSLTATPAAGGHFAQWMLYPYGRSQASTQNPLQLPQPTFDATIRAVFQP